MEWGILWFYEGLKLMRDGLFFIIGKKKDKNLCEICVLKFFLCVSEFVFVYRW